AGGRIGPGSVRSGDFGSLGGNVTRASLDVPWLARAHDGKAGPTVLLASIGANTPDAKRVLVHKGLRDAGLLALPCRVAWSLRRYAALLTANFAVVMSSGVETSLTVLN